MNPQPAHELSQVTYEWLTLLGNKVSKKFCEDEITGHQDYPAVMATVDFLDLGNLEFEAVRADMEHLGDFNYPLLAHFKEVGNERIEIIKDENFWRSNPGLIVYWSGIVIFPKEGSKWHNKNNNEAIVKGQWRKGIAYAWGIIAVISWVISVYYFKNATANIFGLFSLIGVIISIGAWQTSLGIQSRTVKQVCGAVYKGGCDGVLKSKYAKGVFGISPADISLSYFSTSYLIYLLSCIHAPLFTFLPIISTLGILIAISSFYIQGKVLKEWCALCLAIAVILIIQSTFLLFIRVELYWPSILSFSIIILIFIGSLMPLKSIIVTLLKARPKLIELRKWKTDENLFIAQLEREEKVNTDIWHDDLVIGNKNAPIRLTVVCNPYCQPCANSHVQIDSILNRYRDKVSLQVRILADPTKPDDRKTIAMKAILQQASILEQSEAQHMLTDWFEMMDFDRWHAKWNDGKDILVETTSQKHWEWIQNSNITYTPTIFVNGYRLPHRYDLPDLEILTPQLAEVFNIHT